MASRNRLAKSPKPKSPLGTAKVGAPNQFGTGPQKTRLWLMYPPKLITNPVIWELARKFPVITNVRQASVTDEIGIVSLE